ncbi:DUF3109 family protein [Ornithobacterium rhinotracheale]|uniref:DUF3109 family protein n=1 Tax=Ornithobacterium rhinotracheale (strain ATCC 51463 / DSM 15997 / CCUG 23171 / CIP 104009 / LMG 9086) TaxID=867902 RepID=I4A1Z6_ORNRL|nr:DUF3109 family protein [Ornithobacterium rhinotracheale]AFL97980.1 Protein of unknown function (DUF3109) [Ornithobacterium rhinotracheale DSM 15997]AIP99772.1 hypothetical protein Q785_09000 [Ornithobacterium rhinotracheale ORT-UMN 88]KGB65984.1 hypothetical protein Q787_08815 [Ornithobacterium rhinotracheale H06-030791]MBN3661637.1 DUF3109 family protein [Ornithobacterium rhinotracheale]MCK0193728.1 DUF3109 family protein [Ornithobacterium rhinotracheale]
MIQIDYTVISTDVLRKEFVCNLKACKGICCVEGDSGAPLEEEELPILDEIYEKVKPYMRAEGIQATEEQGKYVKDFEDDWVTPLVNNAECAYVIFENGGTRCAIEKAHSEGAIDYKKPISCHLYPIRVNKYKSFSAVNYHAWDICKDACVLGKELGVTVAEFAKEALIRKFGEAWYEQLMIAQKELQNNKLF